MARLTISLFGTFEVVLAGQPITSFEYDKVRALLAYLAVEQDRPHRRETLAGLLWPDQPERKARHSLSQTLFSLRRAIGDHQTEPPFLQVTRQTFQFNQSSDYELDVTTFKALLSACEAHDHHQWESCDLCVGRLQQAVTLYGGSFLEGFSLGDSPAFEEWAVLIRERLQRLVMEALRHLTDCYQWRGKYEEALQYAWRWVELDPWREEAQRQLMRLLTLSGQREAALAQYETCRRLVIKELGVEPGAETTLLYEQIRTETLGARRAEESFLPPPDSLLPFPTTPPPSDSPAPFVARERELAQLEKFLGSALAGRGRVVFVTGDAGLGKTALTQEFARQAHATHPDLIVAGGNGNAQTGHGDPYLPFREVLTSLTGDIEAPWAAGAISQDQAIRLWHLLPLSVQALLDDGPDLIDTFLSGAALLKRAQAFAPDGGEWLPRLAELVKQKAAIPADPMLQQRALFEQYGRVLRALARHKPLLLWLDDLQWIDPGSASLLFHLGRQLEGSRILLVGAYRPAEVALGYFSALRQTQDDQDSDDNERHPLEPVINEFKRYFGEIELDLGQAEEYRFVEAWLDTEPNRLGNAFRQTLYRQTRGHPLFTVELLRGMQERGDLIRDEQGRWVEGSALDWETLPARVEAVIEERLSRLPERLQDVLTVASVEGETFTAEVVARIQASTDRETVGWLSGKLERIHRLVSARGIRQVDPGGQRLSRYRFRHILFQKYLYNKLDQIERVHLHEATGLALETIYNPGTAEIAVQLARHFHEAGIPEKTIDYLRQAGDRAARLSANEEAITHFSRALKLLERLPDSPARTQQELMLQIGLALPLQAVKGYGDPEVGRVYARARELCQQVGETPLLFPVLWLLALFYGAHGEYFIARDIAEQVFRMADRTQDPLIEALANWLMGWNLFYLGEFTTALTHLKRVIVFYDPRHHQDLAFRYGQDPGVTCLSAASWVLWSIGYPDQALKFSRESIALAQDLAHPVSLVLAQTYASTLHIFCQNIQMVQALAVACINLATERGIPYWLSGGLLCHGWAMAREGLLENGIAQMKQAWEVSQSTGAKVLQTFFLGLLADVYGKADQSKQGLTLLEEGLRAVETTGECLYEAELHRLKGELLLKDEGAEANAVIESPEACFIKAIEVARAQQAKSWELRATMSLCRLWRAQGKVVEARRRLEEIYGWFTEGFDTTDLKEAKTLLEELC